MTTWPSDLPTVPVRDGYRVSSDNGLVRTEMESGRARQRRRFVRAYKRVAITWRLSDVELERFRSFFYWDINHGADVFAISLPVAATSRPVSARFVVDSQPRISYRGPALWDLTCELEIISTGVAVLAPLFTNMNTFYAGIVSPITLDAALFTNDNAFFAGVLSVAAASSDIIGFGAMPLGSGPFGGSRV